MKTRELKTIIEVCDVVNDGMGTEIFIDDSRDGTTSHVLATVVPAKDKHGNLILLVSYA